MPGPSIKLNQEPYLLSPPETKPVPLFPVRVSGKSFGSVRGGDPTRGISSGARSLRETSAPNSLADHSWLTSNTHFHHPLREEAAEAGTSPGAKVTRRATRIGSTSDRESGTTSNRDQQCSSNSLKSVACRVRPGVEDRATLEPRANRGPDPHNRVSNPQVTWIVSP